MNKEFGGMSSMDEQVKSVDSVLEGLDKNQVQSVADILPVFADVKPKRKGRPKKIVMREDAKVGLV